MLCNAFKVYPQPFLWEWYWTVWDNTCSNFLNKYLLFCSKIIVLDCICYYSDNLWKTIRCLSFRLEKNLFFMFFYMVLRNRVSFYVFFSLLFFVNEVGLHSVTPTYIWPLTPFLILSSKCHLYPRHLKGKLVRIWLYVHNLSASTFKMKSSKVCFLWFNASFTLGDMILLIFYVTNSSLK